MPWADTDSIGWLRYALDQRSVPYVYLRDEDMRAGDLRDEVRRDPLRPRATWSWPSRSTACRRPGDRCPSRRRRETPSHGTPAESDDITGGIGWDGLAQLQRSSRSGGLLVTLGSGSTLALEGGIVRGVRRAGGVPRSAAAAAPKPRRPRWTP